MYNVNRYHHPVNTNPTREELGMVYRYIKAAVASSGRAECCVTYRSMGEDLKVDYDNLRYRVEWLCGRGAIARRDYVTKNGRSVYLYRILK